MNSWPMYSRLLPSEKIGEGAPSPIFFSEGKGGWGASVSVYLKSLFSFFSLSLFIRKTLIHMLMQLNEAEYHLKNYGDRGGC